jgi:hypothetical protein
MTCYGVRILSLAHKIAARQPGLALYGLSPPKLATPPDELAAIVAQQRARLAALELDGVVVYDIQDEAERTQAPRPFPFLPTMDAQGYAAQQLGGLPAVVYHCVSRDDQASFRRWLGAAPDPAVAVLVGSPSRHTRPRLALDDAYTLARDHAPQVTIGGIAIAERHAARLDEHQRMLAKAASGCRFFVTQAVYDVTSTKSLLSDYALAAPQPAPVVLTLSPCGSERTLGFMKWLGISFPRWLDNELRHARDPLATSVDLCHRIFAEAWEFARDKGVPLGVNVESVSIRKAEIEASLELFRRVKAILTSTPPASPPPRPPDRSPPGY